VLKSWAVPKGPSMNPADRRLAVMVEDHPVSYIHFEGIIPKGNYGAGTVEVWDKGAFIPVDEELSTLTEKQALEGLDKGELKIFLKGEKLEGGFVIVRMKPDEKNWLLIKHKDEYAVTGTYDAENFTKASLKSKSTTANKSATPQKARPKTTRKTTVKKKK
jgi:bifunctional non-homologous end joining protein LigD